MSLNKKHGKWVDDVLVCSDGTLMTVRENGNLEIRGDGWGQKKKKSDSTVYDKVRICRGLTINRARKIAELVAKLLYEDPKKEGNIYHG